MMSPMPWLAAWPRNGRRLWGRRTLVFVTKRAAPEATVALRPRGLASSLQSSVQSKVALKQPLARHGPEWHSSPHVWAEAGFVRSCICAEGSVDKTQLPVAGLGV